MRFWDAAADLALATACAGCGDRGRIVCEACTRLLGDERPRCVVGREMVVAAHEYTDPVRGLLIAYKEHGAWSLTPLLGTRLAVAVARVWGGLPDVGELTLIPIPSRSRAVRDRGLDTTRRLCQASAHRLGRATGAGVTVQSALRIVRPVSDQGSLSAVERASNVAGAFAAQRRPKGAVCIVDDICTTGATLAEAGRVAREARWDLIGSAVVAASSLRT